MSYNRPYVILDFQFEAGLLYVALQNIGDYPAYNVGVKFKPTLRGLGGHKLVSKLPLFQNITFFAPHKTIRTLLDSSAAYFDRKESTLIQVVIAYADSNKKQYREKIHHDLQIYREIAYIPADISV